MVITNTTMMEIESAVDKDWRNSSSSSNGPNRRRCKNDFSFSYDASEHTASTASMDEEDCHPRDEEESREHEHPKISAVTVTEVYHDNNRRGGNNSNNDNSNKKKHGYSFLRNQEAQNAGRAAKKRLEEMKRFSRLLHSSTAMGNGRRQEKQNPMTLSWDDVFVEDMLGMGSFGSVFVVTCPKLRRRQRQQRQWQKGTTAAVTGEAEAVPATVLSSPHPFDESESLHTNTEMMVMSATTKTTTTTTTATTTHDGDDDESVASSTCSSSSRSNHQYGDPSKYYACKSLSNKTMYQTNVRGFVQAVTDLIQESFLLSNLPAHRNIVRLYGVPKGDAGEFFDSSLSSPEDHEINNDKELGYFLIMEALMGGILNDKISRWRRIRKQQRMMTSPLRRIEQHQLHYYQQNNNNNNNNGSPETFLVSSQQQMTASSNGTTTARYQHRGRYKMPPSSSMVGEQRLRQQIIPSLSDRIDIALQIAEGMNHLHSHRIVFRDLKPHNVGLSSRPVDDEDTTTMTWRLFDFGLAREVLPKEVTSSSSSTPSSSTSSESFAVSDANTTTTTTTMLGGVGNNDPIVRGKAGSPRYMAPETMGGRYGRRPRGSKGAGNHCFSTYQSDSYSFGVLLWELISLRDFDDDTKFRHGNITDFETAVCDYGYRPDIHSVDETCLGTNETLLLDALVGEERDQLRLAFAFVLTELKHLMLICWNDNHRRRPVFLDIVAKLKQLLSLLTMTMTTRVGRGGKGTDLVDPNNNNGTDSSTSGVAVDNATQQQENNRQIGVDQNKLVDVRNTFFAKEEEECNNKKNAATTAYANANNNTIFHSNNDYNHSWMSGCEEEQDDHRSYLSMMNCSLLSEMMNDSVSLK